MTGWDLEISAVEMSAFFLKNFCISLVVVKKIILKNSTEMYFSNAQFLLSAVSVCITVKGGAFIHGEKAS